ncbi:hypothetical protein [Lederbergia lenta]|uniref:Uncharacterized protein n=1 Tax=Lederbergia lenta TaxID=1467 RepID=A0A2X4VR65_LEDLE|nr:hypothetical protein [Lederbergia lenta]MCM3113216.1 hypothetical protein [Lederbergia lenta]MEC2325995.1 hypothetical protein [Lederbergia lenta]SQI53391.1 Uncharacterised protein [Lederbergia lenta]
MLVLVDEFLALDQTERIKKIKLKGKFYQLQDAIRLINPRLVARKLKIQLPSLNDELEYFSKLFQEEDKIVYFYDARYQSGEILDRIQNWLLPDKILWPIPIVNGNKAEFLFLLDEVMQYNDASTSYTDLMARINTLRSNMTYWIMSPSPMLVFSPNKYNAIYKKKERNIFLLTEVLSKNRVKTHQSGEVNALWSYLREKKQIDEIWAVSKGITSELPALHKHVKLEEPTLPVGIPYIQILTINKDK